MIFLYKFWRQIYFVSFVCFEGRGIQNKKYVCTFIHFYICSNILCQLLSLSVAFLMSQN